MIEVRESREGNIVAIHAEDAAQTQGSVLLVTDAHAGKMLDHLVHGLPNGDANTCSIAEFCAELGVRSLIEALEGYQLVAQSGRTAERVVVIYPERMGPAARKYAGIPEN